MKTLSLTLCAFGLAAGVALADQSGGEKLRPGMLATTSGQEIYQQICQGCHMPDGKGAIGAGRYPALAGDPALASPDFVALTLLTGRRNMPMFGNPVQPDAFFVPARLDDVQIAAVANFVRTGFGNRFKGTLTPAQVKALRESLQAR